MFRRVRNYLWVILGVMLLFIGCTKDGSDKDSPNVSEKEIIHCAVDAKTDSYASLNEVENDADIIVRGVRLEDEEIVIEKSGKNVLSAYTFSKVKVISVYNASSSKILEGDVITVLENEAYDEETQTVYHIAGYNMMVEGNEYILFLKESQLNNEVYYVSVGVNYGTVSVEDDGRTVQKGARTNNITADYSEYEDIWSAAKDKYK